VDAVRDEPLAVPDTVTTMPTLRIFFASTSPFTAADPSTLVEVESSISYFLSLIYTLPNFVIVPELVTGVVLAEGTPVPPPPPPEQDKAASTQKPAPSVANKVVCFMV
jgi:hypothetical protein